MMNQPTIPRMMTTIVRMNFVAPPVLGNLEQKIFRIIGIGC